MHDVELMKVVDTIYDLMKESACLFLGESTIVARVYFFLSAM